MLTTMYITNNPEVALIAEKNGVDRIWIDLETLGKEERQKNMNTVKSNHKISDIYKIKPLLSSSKLLVRINPWNENSKEEIEKVIKAGAEIIMLPMWKTYQEVKEFIQIIDGRVKTMLLLETKEGAECLDNILDIEGIDEIHIGLNDLHLSYNLKFMFELLSNGAIEKICGKIAKKNIPYGFGGIAKIGEGLLPAENILIEHYRLGSTRVILSRSFCNSEINKNKKELEKIFYVNMKKLREVEKRILNLKENEFMENKIKIAEIVKTIINN